MAFNHRKLILDSINITIISESCYYYCNPKLNSNGYCPNRCISLCNATCVTPIEESQFLPPTTSSIPNPNKHHTLSLPLLISLSILALTFTLFLTYTTYRYFKSKQRRTGDQAETEETHDEFLDQDHGPPFVDHPIWHIRTVGLNQSIINAITVCKFKKGEGLVEGTECSVCLSEFLEDETLRLLPKCNHAFHIPCIDTWLRSHTNCPMCRAGIVNNSPVVISPEPELEPNSDHSEELEETHVGILENSEESERESEYLSCEMRIGIEEIGTSSDHVIQVDEVQPMRRSVSLDSSAASLISFAVNNGVLRQSGENSNTQLVKMEESNMGCVPKRVDVNQSLLRLVGSSSIGRSLQKGPVSMKRSLSCSGKVFMSRFGRSQSRRRNSVIPL